jgi:hypothetical protein
MTGKGMPGETVYGGVVQPWRGSLGSPVRRACTEMATGPGGLRGSAACFEPFLLSFRVSFDLDQYSRYGRAKKKISPLQFAY